MSCTDDDIKLIKGLLEMMNSPTQMVNNLLKIGTLLPPLLARLEAAEACAEIYAEDWPNGDTASTWRKAAGK